LQPAKILNIKFPISLVRYIPSKAVVGIIDEINTFRMYDIEEYHLTGGFRINLPLNKPLENSVAISPNGKYLAIAISGKSKTTIWEVESKKLLYTLGWHKGEVLSCAFDNNDEYLITGGSDSRVYMWSMKVGKMVSSLPPHADYVMALGFSKNNMWAASGSYDRLISITNISSFSVTYRKKSHKGAITQLKFLKDSMISGDKTGEIVVWDYLKGEVKKRLTGLADSVIDFTWDENEEFLFVITNDKHIFLFDLEKAELISDKFIKLGEFPSSITYVPETNSLWIGTLGGSVYIYNLFEEEEALSKAIFNKNYARAYEIVSSNPLLKRTNSYKTLEDIWERTFETAHKLLEKGDGRKARQLLAPFLEVPLKRGIIQHLLNDFVEFERFKRAVVNGRYPLAYSLASMYPAFKDTAYYRKMEEHWKKAFNKARELIKMNARDDLIREVLMPFRGVSEKAPHIHTLITDKQLYDLFKNKLLSKQFADFFTLLNRYPFLYDTPEYEMAIKYGEKLEKSANEELKNGNFKKAMLLANTLEEFPNMKEKAQNIALKANLFSLFLKQLAENDVDSVEENVIKYPFLEESVDYHEFKKKINERFFAAENALKNNDIESMKKVLLPISNSAFYKKRIMQMFKSLYLNQLLEELAKFSKSKKKEVLNRLVKGIENYIKLFGDDLEIEDIITQLNKIKKTKINTSLNLLHLPIEAFPKFIWEEI